MSANHARVVVVFVVDLGRRESTTRRRVRNRRHARSSSSSGGGGDNDESFVVPLVEPLFRHDGVFAPRDVLEDRTLVAQVARLPDCAPQERRDEVQRERTWNRRQGLDRVEVDRLRLEHSRHFVFIDDDASSRFPSSVLIITMVLVR